MQVIKKRSSSKKKILLGIVICVILLGGVLAIAAVKNLGPFKDEASTENAINYEEPSDDQLKAGEDIKQQTIDSTKPTDASSGSDTAISSPSSSSGAIGVEITQAEVESGTLRVRALIQEVNNSGACTLILSKSGQADVIKAAQTQPLASSSTCKGFDIGTANLAKGTWELTIKYKSNKSNGSSSQQVTI